MSNNGLEGYDFDDLQGSGLEGYDADEILGALAKKGGLALKKGWMPRPFAPGVPKIGPRLQPLPFTVTTFAAGTAAGTVQQVTADTQKPFRGERLVVVLDRSAGAAAVGINISRIQVGVDLQQAGIGQVPAAAFGATAVGVRMVADANEPGVRVAIDYTNIIAVPAGESVSVSTVWFGRTLT